MALPAPSGCVGDSDIVLLFQTRILSLLFRFSHAHRHT